MENTRASALLLVLAILVVGNGQSYFAGLNLDPFLLSQADAAINDLKTSLSQNFNCQPQNPLFMLSGFWQNMLFFPFKTLHGFSGYNANPPTVTCLFGQSRAFLSIYQKLVKVMDLLEKIRSCLIQYNNIIIGSENSVVGANNLVIGSKDNFSGNNNWVFTSDFNSADPLNGVIILGSYLIELEDMMQITYNPTAAIHCIGQSQSNQHFSSFWNQVGQNRRFVF